MPHGEWATQYVRIGLFCGYSRRGNPVKIERLGAYDVPGENSASAEPRALARARESRPPPISRPPTRARSSAQGSGGIRTARGSSTRSTSGSSTFYSAVSTHSRSPIIGCSRRTRSLTSRGSVRIHARSRRDRAEIAPRWDSEADLKPSSCVRRSAYDLVHSAAVHQGRPPRLRHPLPLLIPQGAILLRWPPQRPAQPAPRAVARSSGCAAHASLASARRRS